jgi:hypothetical protein
MTFIPTLVTGCSDIPANNGPSGSGSLRTLRASIPRMTSVNYGIGSSPSWGLRIPGKVSVLEKIMNQSRVLTGILIRDEEARGTQ